MSWLAIIFLIVGIIWFLMYLPQAIDELKELFKDK